LFVQTQKMGGCLWTHITLALYVCTDRRCDYVQALGGWVSVQQQQQQQQRGVCQYGTLWEAPSSLVTVGGDDADKKSIVVQFVN
jgi:hypothetical protein